MKNIQDRMYAALKELEHISIWGEGIDPSATRIQDCVQFHLSAAVGYIEDFKRDEIHNLLNNMKHRCTKD